MTEVEAIARWLESHGILCAGLARGVREGEWRALMGTEDRPMLKIHAGRATLEEGTSPTPPDPAPASEPPADTVSPASSPAGDTTTAPAEVDPRAALAELVARGALTQADVDRMASWTDAQVARLVELAARAPASSAPASAAPVERLAEQAQAEDTTDDAPAPGHVPAGEAAAPSSPAPERAAAVGAEPEDRRPLDAPAPEWERDEVPPPNELESEERTPDEDAPLQAPSPEQLNVVANAATASAVGLPEPRVLSRCVNAKCGAAVTALAPEAKCHCGFPMLARLTIDPGVPSPENVPLLVAVLELVDGAAWRDRACSACGDLIQAEDKKVMIGRRGPVTHVLHTACVVSYAPDHCVRQRPDPDPIGAVGDETCDECDECGTPIKPGQRWLKVGDGTGKGVRLHETDCPTVLDSKPAKGPAEVVPDWSKGKVKKVRKTKLPQPPCEVCKETLVPGTQVVEVEAGRKKARAHLTCVPEDQRPLLETAPASTGAAS